MNYLNLKSYISVIRRITFKITSFSFLAMLIGTNLWFIEGLDDTFLGISRLFGNKACVLGSGVVDAVRSSNNLVEIIDISWDNC